MSARRPPLRAARRAVGAATALCRRLGGGCPGRLRALCFTATTSLPRAGPDPARKSGPPPTSASAIARRSSSSPRRCAWRRRAPPRSARRCCRCCGWSLWAPCRPRAGVGRRSSGQAADAGSFGPDDRPPPKGPARLPQAHPRRHFCKGADLAARRPRGRILSGSFGAGSPASESRRFGCAHRKRQICKTSTAGPVGAGSPRSAPAQARPCAAG